MTTDDMRSSAEALRTRLMNDSQFKARVMQDPAGTLSAEGYGQPIISDVQREVADESDEDVAGYATPDCFITCFITLKAR